MVSRWGFCLVAACLVVGSPKVSLAAERIALVIGNAGYEHLPTLENASNDAKSMAGTLRALGF